jgi:CMP-N-acetylneuraminic acid synthetase
MIIAIIPAKGESKRLKNKNMQLLLGKPMIQYAVDYAKQSKRISKIYVTTDNDTIAEYAESQDLDVIIRSSNLGGETPLLDVYYHAINMRKINKLETVAGIQPDHPDRNYTLDEALDKYENDALDCLYSKDGKGQKNGAHSIMSAKGILQKKFEKVGYIEDDCTNVHYESDLLLAEQRLMSRKN